MEIKFGEHTRFFLAYLKPMCVCTLKYSLYHDNQLMTIKDCYHYQHSIVETYV